MWVYFNTAVCKTGLDTLDLLKCIYLKLSNLGLAGLLEILLYLIQNHNHILILSMIYLDLIFPVCFPSAPQAPLPCYWAHRNTKILVLDIKQLKHREIANGCLEYISSVVEVSSSYRTWINIAGNIASIIAESAILPAILLAILPAILLISNIAESAILLTILLAILLIQQYCWQYCWHYCWIFSNIADNIAI